MASGHAEELLVPVRNPLTGRERLAALRLPPGPTAGLGAAYRSRARRRQPPSQRSAISQCHLLQLPRTFGPHSILVAIAMPVRLYRKVRRARVRSRRLSIRRLAGSRGFSVQGSELFVAQVRGQSTVPFRCTGPWTINLTSLPMDLCKLIGRKGGCPVWCSLRRSSTTTWYGELLPDPAGAGRANG